MNGLEAWDAVVLGPMTGGARSRLWRVEIGSRLFVARRATEGEPSLRWLARLQGVAEREGVRLAAMVPSRYGTLTVAGWTVEPWLDGVQGTVADLFEIRRALRRLHRATRRWPERPGPVMRLPAGLERRIPRQDQAAERAAVHGDVHSGNLIRLASGGVALIDWEEARLGDVRLDLGYPHTAQGRAAHTAAEVRACWWAEPERARAMARRLRRFWT
jgi:Ser/Thr protein kinase RdoA (MazF antagonist)